MLSVGGFILGGAAGYAFGLFQNNAREKNRKLREQGKFSAGALVPGSMTRIVLLLLVLAGFQIAFPSLFNSGPVQWLISAGVVLGYGWALFVRFRTRPT